MLLLLVVIINIITYDSSILSDDSIFEPEFLDIQYRILPVAPSC